MRKTTHIGDPGTRVCVSGRVVSCDRVETEWGVAARIKFEADDGTLVWWLASNGLDLSWDLKPGDPITVRATVQRYFVHEPDDTLWVQLTRGKVLEEALPLG